VSRDKEVELRLVIADVGRKGDGSLDNRIDSAVYIGASSVSGESTRSTCISMNTCLSMWE